MVGPAFAHGVMSSVAGARAECTITGTAANDNINGTTRDDVICAKAGEDAVNGREGNDVIRGGQGDDGGGRAPLCSLRKNRRSRSQACNTVVVYQGQPFGLRGGDGSDTIRGQQDDDSIEGYGQNDELYGGQGADCLGAYCTTFSKQVSPEGGNDFLKSKDRVSGNDYVDGGNNTDRCVIDAADEVHNCEE
jgi:Ca2+-binding RTX toxin-like protein